MTFVHSRSWLCDEWIFENGHGRDDISGDLTVGDDRKAAFPLLFAEIVHAHSIDPKAHPRASFAKRVQQRAKRIIVKR
jgi:hypothetical protein